MKWRLYASTCCRSCHYSRFFQIFGITFLTSLAFSNWGRLYCTARHIFDVNCQNKMNILHSPKNLLNTQYIARANDRCLSGTTLKETNTGITFEISRIYYSLNFSWREANKLPTLNSFQFDPTRHILHYLSWNLHFVWAKFMVSTYN